MSIREREVTLNMTYGDMLWLLNAATREARRLGKNGHPESAARLFNIASNVHDCVGNGAQAWALAEEAQTIRVAAAKGAV